MVYVLPFPPLPFENFGFLIPLVRFPLAASILDHRRNLLHIQNGKAVQSP